MIIINVMASSCHGRIILCKMIPVNIHPKLVINIVIFITKVTSNVSVSYVNRFIIRPVGVVSKYDMGAYKTLDSISTNIRVAHLAPPWMIQLVLRMVVMQDTNNMIA